MDARQIYQTVNKNAITENQAIHENWLKYRDEFQTTRDLVESLPAKLSHRVMVPLGTKALIPGKMIHTNEFFVNIGGSYTVKKTAKQTTEYCDRRIKECNEMLKKVENDLEFLENQLNVSEMNDAFGSDERPEIFEEISEEEDKAWRDEHRQKVKAYHERLAVLRQNEKKIENEEDLWNRLDQLELEEELEDELNRIGSEELTESRKKSVVFMAESHDEQPDPLILNFKHSENPIIATKHQTPGDLYQIYLDNLPKPVSILKVKKNPHELKEREALLKTPKSVQSTYQISDIVEHVAVAATTPKPQTRRVSKFKASRLK